MSGIGAGRHPKYGCPQNFNRGSCPNDLVEREDWLESRILANLQQEVLRPEVIEFALEEFRSQLEAHSFSLAAQLGDMQARKLELEMEIRRLTDFVAKGSGDSEFLRAAIVEREREIRGLAGRLLDDGPGTLKAELENMRSFVRSSLDDIRGLLAEGRRLQPHERNSQSM